MSELLVIGYPEEAAALEAWNALVSVAGASVDAAAVSRGAAGRVRVRRIPRTPLRAMQSGFSRLRSLRASGIGGHAIPSAAVDHNGIVDEFVMRFGAELAVQTSAVIVLVSREGLAALTRILSRWSGTVLRSTLGRHGERDLQRALRAECPASNMSVRPLSGAFGDSSRLAAVPGADAAYSGARVVFLNPDSRVRRGAQ